MTNFFSLTDLGLSASSSSLLAEWLDAMTAAFPGYSPANSNLEYVQAQIFSSLAADLAALASSGATELFRTYATTLVGVPYLPGTAAQAVISIQAASFSGTLATTTQALTTSGAIVVIPVVALEFGISAGTITITDPTNLSHTEDFTTPGADAGDTVVSVSVQTPSFNYPTNSTITGNTATQAYELDSLTQFSLDSLGFNSLAPLTIDAGTAQNVTLTAVQAGVLFNGAGQGGNIQSIQQLSWVQTMTLVAAASGGNDPEDDQEYLNRVTGVLQLQAPRPITASDYAQMALSFTPFPGTDQQEIGRATAVDGYNPVDMTFNNTRMVAVAVTDTNGFALNNDTLYGYPNGTSTAVVTTVPNQNSGWGVAGWLENFREINFIVNVINPTYTPIYVTVTVKATDGYDSTSVQLNVQAALLGYLSPASWGLPTPSQSGWQNSITIFQSRLMSVVQNSLGVDHVVDGTLKFDTSATPANTADLVIAGPIALPTSTVLTIPTASITVT